MSLTLRFVFLCATLFAALGPTTSPSNAANIGVALPEYVFTDLGEVIMTGGGARDINQLGQVALNLDGNGYVWDNGVLSPTGALRAFGYDWRAQR